MTSNELSSLRHPDVGPIILRPTGDALVAQDLRLCIRAFRRGGLLAFPTDTVYGLGADATSPRAVRRLFEAKGRPADNPLPVLIGCLTDLRKCAREVPKMAWALIEAFWPGPLTIVLRRTEVICSEAVAGGDTVGLRMPRHKLARQLLSTMGQPMAVTSANPSGEESTISAEEVLRTLGDWIDVLIEQPSPGSGLPSTVIDLTVQPPRVQRWGGVTLAQLINVIGEVASP
ncbi:MAG: L-threonylcarbamoyladenylate synthase [Candidatus Zipacnadales bacterium]